LKPWLIEINSSPSLDRGTSDLDNQIKTQLIKDTIDVVNPPNIDWGALYDICRRRLGKTKKSKCKMNLGSEKTEHTVDYRKLTDRDSLDTDLRRILCGKLPRSYGELPQEMGSYERLAPGTQAYDSLMKSSPKYDKCISLNLTRT